MLSKLLGYLPAIVCRYLHGLVPVTGSLGEFSSGLLMVEFRLAKFEFRVEKN